MEQKMNRFMSRFYDIQDYYRKYPSYEVRI